MWKLLYHSILEFEVKDFNSHNYQNKEVPTVIQMKKKIVKIKQTLMSFFMKRKLLGIYMEIKY